MAMKDKLDMSLDDIISQENKRGGGRGRGRGFSNRGLSTGRSNFNRGQFNRGTRGSFSRPDPYSRQQQSRDTDQWQHDKFEDYRSPPSRRIGGGSAHIRIFNLDWGVSDMDIQELFNEFGSIRKSYVNYDRSGRSEGSADVFFDRDGDAHNAMKNYNGIPLDGRKMQIEFVGDKSGFSTRRNMDNGSSPPFNRRGGGFRGGSRGGGGGRFFRGGRGGGGNRVEKTAEELDAELDAYNSEIKN